MGIAHQSRSLLPVRPRTRDVFCTALFILLTWLGGDTSIGAAESIMEPSSQANKPIEFRKVYVPQDRSEAWPTEGKQYLPLTHGAFDELVQAAQQKQGTERVRVVRAAHQARLAGSSEVQLKPLLLEGVSALEVQLDGNKPELLELPCSAMAILDARWEGASNQPAVIGNWHVPGEDQEGGTSRLGLLVDRSDTLILKWRLAADRSAKLASHFGFRLSVAPLQDLELSLPAEYQLIASSLFGLQETSSEGGATQWNGKLHPADTHHLKIAAKSQQSLLVNGSLRVTQHDEYLIRPVGMDYRATFVVAGASEGDVLSLVSSDLLKIQEVVMDGEQVSWRRDSVRKQRIIIELPGDSNPREVVVRATSHLVEGSLWRLPKLVVPFENWKEGTCVLRFDERLELQSLAPTAASLVQIESDRRTEFPAESNAPASIETYKLRYFTEKAAVSAIVRARDQQLSMKQATLLDFGDEYVTSQVRLTLSASANRAFQLRGKLLPNWEITSVLSEAPTDLAHWQVQEAIESPELHLQFKRSPNRSNPIVVRMTARRLLSSLSFPMGLSQLNLLTFPQDRLTKHVCAVQTNTAAQFQVRVEQAAADPASSEKDEADFDWLDPNPNRQVVDLLTTPSEPLLRQEAIENSLEATASLHVQPEKSRVGYQVDFRINPQQGLVSELTIVSSQKLPERASWRILSADAKLLVEQINAASGVSRSDETDQPEQPVTYRVRLPKPQDREFVVRLIYSRPAVETQQRIDRFYLPAASPWHAWALIVGTHQGQSQSTRSYRVESGGCTPVTPPALTAVDEFLLGCFRFEQDDPLAKQNAPIIYATTAESDRTATSNKPETWHEVVATEAAVETDYSAAGIMRGVVKYRLQRQLHWLAPLEIGFTFPSDVRLISAEIDGQLVNLQGSQTPRKQGNAYRLALPPSGNSSVELRYESTIKRLTAGTSLHAHLPSTSFPILHGKWTLKTPLNFEVASSIKALEKNSDRNLAGIFNRLLGPLVRPKTVRPTPSLDQEIESVNLGYVETTREFASNPAPIVIRRPAEQLGFWLTVWFAATLATCWLIVRRPRLVLHLLVACAAACLLLPATAIAVPQAIFLGCLAGGMVQIVFQGTLFDEELPQKERKSLVPATAVALALLAYFATQSEHAIANETPPAVLIPYTEPQLTPSEKVYVPQQLLQELQRASQLSQTSGADWVLQGANYAITLDQAAMDEPLQARESRLTFRFRTVVDQVIVELPLHRHDATWDLAKSLLDGMPCGPSWSDKDNMLRLKIEERGLHELQLTVIPKINRGPEASKLELAIPRFPGAQLEIAKPQSFEEFTIDSVTEVATRRSDRLVSAVLGATDKLTLSWKPSSLVNPAKLRVEQFEWLAIDPDRITGEAKLRLLGEQLPEALTLVHTLVMQIDSVVDQAGNSLEIIPQANGRESVAQLPVEATLPLDLQVAFHLNRPSLGRVSFPYLYIKELQRIRRLFAVSVADELSFQEDQREKLKPISPEEFTALWPSDIPTPDLAYAMQSKHPNWSVSVRPRGELVILDPRMDLNCRAQHVNLTLTATMVDTRSSAHQRLVVPETFEVDQIEIVVGEDQRVPLRWSRAAENKIELFLREPLSEPGTIRILGKLKSPKTGDLNFPMIEFEEAHQATPLVEIIQHLDVQAQLLNSDSETIQPATQPKHLFLPDLEVPLGEFALNAEALRATKLNVTPYEATFRAETATVLRDETTADYAIDLHASSGKVQRLTILADQSWTPQSDSHAEFEISPNGKGHARLRRFEIVLKEPLKPGQRRTFTVSGELTNQAAYRLRIPRIELAAGRIDRRFLVIPTALNGRSIAWQLSGLQRKSLSRRLSNTLDASEVSRSFQVTRESYAAEQRIFPDQLRRARIRHAETAGVFDESGTWVGTTRLLLQPGRATACAVKAPAGIEILAIKVAGRRVPLDANTPNSTTVTLGSPYLPVELAVVYRQTVPGGSSTASLRTPQLAMAEQTLPIRQMHWQVRKTGKAWSVHQGTQQHDATEYHRQGLVARVDAVSEAAPMALQLHPQESRNWLRPWRERIEASINHPLIAIAGAEEHSATLESPREDFQLLETWEELKQIFPNTEHTQEDRATTSDPSTKLAKESGLPQSTIAAVYLATDGSSPLELSRESHWPTLLQWLSLGVLFVAYFFSKNLVDRLWSRIQAIESHTWQRRAQIALLLLGFCWWLFLVPRVLGAALAAIAAACLIKQAVARLAQKRRANHLSMESTAHQPASP